MRGGDNHGISNLRILRYVFIIPRVFRDTGKCIRIPVASRYDPDNRNDARLFTGGVYECWTDGVAVLRILYQSYFYQKVTTYLMCISCILDVRKNWPIWK